MPAADLPEDVRNSLLALIEYNWDDERLDAGAQIVEWGSLKKHIFVDLVRLRNFATGESDVAEELATKEYNTDDDMEDTTEDDMKDDTDYDDYDQID